MMFNGTRNGLFTLQSCYWSLIDSVKPDICSMHSPWPTPYKRLRKSCSESFCSILQQVQNIMPYMQNPITFLDRNDDHSDGHNQIKTWLRGHYNLPNFLDQFPTVTLRFALRSAVQEIYFCIEATLDACIDAGRESYQRLDVDAMDFWGDDQQIDAEALCHHDFQDIVEMGRERLIMTLKEARVEIAWGRNEIGRMRVHLENAARLIAIGDRERFYYRPLPRQR